MPWATATATASTASGAFAFSASTGTSSPPSWARAASTGGVLSDLVSTTTGCTPWPGHQQQVALDPARLKSTSSPQTTNAVSMLAAITR